MPEPETITMILISILISVSVRAQWTGIIVCCGYILMDSADCLANRIRKQQFGRQDTSICVALLVYWAMYLPINLIYINLPELPLCAFFLPPDNVPTFYDLLWIVVVNDFILKSIAVLAKIGVTLMPARMIPYQKRGKYYLFLGVTSQLHRQLAPLQPWLMYLLNYNGDGAISIPNTVLGLFLTAAYMVIKGQILVKYIKSFKDACVKLMQSTRCVNSQSVK